MQLTEDLDTDDLWMFLRHLPDVDAHDLPPDIEVRELVIERLGTLPVPTTMIEVADEHRQELAQRQLTPADILIAHGSQWSVWGDLDNVAETLTALLERRDDLRTDEVTGPLASYLEKHRPGGMRCVAAGVDHTGWVDHAVNDLIDAVAAVLRRCGFDLDLVE